MSPLITIVEGKNMQRVVINDLLCDGCENCVQYCTYEAIYMEGGQAHIIEDECTLCALCIPECHVNAISMVTE